MENVKKYNVYDILLDLITKWKLNEDNLTIVDVNRWPSQKVHNLDITRSLEQI